MLCSCLFSTHAGTKYVLIFASTITGLEVKKSHFLIYGYLHTNNEEIEHLTLFPVHHYNSLLPYR